MQGMTVPFMNPSLNSEASMSPSLPTRAGNSVHDGFVPERRKRRPPKRQTWSCVPCRERKAKCNRVIPCESCIRHGREQSCRMTISAETISNPYSAAAPPFAPALQRPGNEVRKPGLDQLSPIAFQRALNLSTLPQQSPDSDFSPFYFQEPHVQAPRLENQSVSSFAMLRATRTLRKPLMASKPRQDAEVNMEDNEFHSSNPFVPEYSSSFTSSVATSEMSSDFDTDESTRWRIRLISVLPSQTQCDILLSFFLEDLNRLYQAIHMPTFRAEYVQFWQTNVHDVDLIWLSLLYAIICTSVLYIPTQLSLAIFQDTVGLSLARKWYSASRQCLYAGGFETNACLTQLQTFLITQPYWIGMNDMETMNSCLAQAIRAAQSIGLEKDTAVANCIEDEMRHRIWWDICCSDLTWSRYLGLQPFIQAYISPVPIPQNCNDFDMTAGTLRSRLMTEPTETSLNVIRIQFVKILSRLYSDSRSKEASFDLIMSIDSEIVTLLDQVPWYLKPTQTDSALSLPKEFNFIAWQSHLLHTFIHVQRLKMYKPFLQSFRRPALQMSIAAAESALAVYRNLRKRIPGLPQLTNKAATHSWQICSTAITLGIFILVERPTNLHNVPDDIKLVVSDLENLQATGFNIPCVVAGSKILRKILEMYESNGNNITMSPTSLVPEVYTLTGGRSTTQKYLERCAIEFIINPDIGPSSMNSSRLQQSSIDSGTGISYLTPRSFESFPSNVDFPDTGHFDLTQGADIWDRWTFF